MGIPDLLTCLLRSFYAGKEAAVRAGHGTDWLKIWKGAQQGCILSSCIFNLAIVGGSGEILCDEMVLYFDCSGDCMNLHV